MKRMKKAISLLCSMFLLTTSVSFANEDLETRMLGRAEKVISELNLKYGDKTKVTIDRTKDQEEFVELIQSMNDEELYNYFHEFYKACENPEIKAVTVEEKVIDSGSPKATVRRTAKVWSGIPALGHAYIFINYTVGYNYSTKYFTSAKINSTWQEGISIGQWRELFNKTVVRKTSVDLITTGILKYSIPGTTAGIQTEETFKYTDSNRNF